MRTLHVAAVIVWACLATQPLAHAQSYPAKPIRIINPYTPGGSVDAILRPLTQKMAESLKQNILVD